MASKNITLSPIHLNNVVVIDTGNGSPESSVIAPAGSLYLDEAGKLWVKQSGTGATGWAEAGSGGGGGAAGSDTEVQYNSSGALGASPNFTFDSTNNRVFATELRCGASDVYGTFSREATSGTGANLDKLSIQAAGSDGHISISSQVKGLGSYQLCSSSYLRNQPYFLGIDIQLYTLASTQTASGLYSTCIGNTNTASGNNSTSVGSANIASSTFATAIGYNTMASGPNSTSVGSSSEATKTDSIALGNYSKARIVGMASFASGRKAATGDRQSAKLHLRASTTNSTATSATVGGSALSASNSLVLDAGTCVSGMVTFTGWDGNDHCYQRRRFHASRKSGGNVIVHMNTSEGTNNSIGFSGYATSVVANTTYQCVDFQVTGVGSKSIEWLASVEWSEVIV